MTLYKLSNSPGNNTGIFFAPTNMEYGILTTKKIYYEQRFVMFRNIRVRKMRLINVRKTMKLQELIIIFISIGMVFAVSSCNRDPEITFLSEINYEGTIVYSSGEYSKADIYIINADGSHVKRLTKTDGYDLSPHLSPDGSKILFYSNRDGDDDVYVMNPDGSNVQNLTNNSRANEWYPCWSPDGKYIAFSSDRDGNHNIYIMDNDGKNMRKIIDHPAKYDIKPDWSPDGTRMAFASNRNGNYDIFVVNVDGSNLIQLTDDQGSDTCPHWSPDGTQLVYSAYHNDEDIYIMNADGSSKKPLYKGQHNDFVPCWSPDGKQIAFQTTVKSAGKKYDDEICIIDIESKNLFRLTNSPGWDTMPHWSPLSLKEIEKNNIPY